VTLNTLTSPSNDQVVRLRTAPLSNPNTNAGALAPSIDGKTVQYACTTGSVNAIPSQYLADMYTSLPLSNSTHRTPDVAQSIEENGLLALGLSVGLGFTPSLAGDIQNGSTHLCICNGDRWSVWCPLAWEHCNVAMNVPLPVIRLPCTCPSDLPMGQVPKSCSLVADHLFYMVSYYPLIYVKDVGLRVIINRCMNSPISEPPRSEVPLRAPPSRRALPIKTTVELALEVLPLKISSCHLGRQASPREDEKLKSPSTPNPASPPHSSTPLSSPSYLFPRMEHPLRPKTSPNLPTSLIHSAFTQDHWAEIFT